jgi:hypothetical protein
MKEEEHTSTRWSKYEGLFFCEEEEKQKKNLGLFVKIRKWNTIFS